MQTTTLLTVAGLVLVATSLVVVGDTAGKLLTQDGVSPVFVAWARFALGALIILPLSGLNSGEIRNFLNPKIVMRAVFIAGGICSILTALRSEPIANVFGAFFIGPMVSYILAVVFLKEPITKLRTILLLIGFLGVMLVVKPGFGATPGIGFALLAGCFYGAYLTMTRAISGDLRPRFLLLSQLVVGAILLAPIGATSPWPEPSRTAYLLILTSAMASAMGNYLLVRASRMASATIIAPFIYNQLFAATILGVLVFNELPDAVSLLGLVLIALSGFGTLLAVRRQDLGRV